MQRLFDMKVTTFRGKCEGGIGGWSPTIAEAFHQHGSCRESALGRDLTLLGLGE